MCIYVRVGAYDCGYVQSPEKGTGSPGTRIR